ncbi:DUF3043 domain-containing protein [Mycetocola zhujimingii]|uniref:DUF3043 domain-containing protein n=1 Tax=Mycetocola zhujimingii TaxID=2079792 RepID=A0A2U1TG39_9MICO|nr:DUF3043 domain-containing protein [Mycetocola zhujimingii]AWB86303.1 DUF3043 domain-containing protein [Mycetocola zhujimingii]PWC07855.1 DUF3043 domain-containing protein [Mycetocola zhujimingii]
MTKHTPRSTAEPIIETPDQTAERIAAAGKGRPTPTRKEREALNKRPLVPGDRKEAKLAARAKLAESREKARIGLAAGDERYLPQRDRGVQKRWVRDYVDARFNIGEFLIPVMFVVIILTFIPSPVVQVYGMLALWAFFLIALIDCFWMGTVIRKKLRAKFGTDNVERGVRWYAGMRALQLRVLRLPKPQVKRGDYPA